MKSFWITLVLCGFVAAQTTSPDSGQPELSSRPAIGQSEAYIPIQQKEEPGVKKAKALLNKMIQALGGQKYLTIQDMEYSGRTYGFFRGEPTGAGAPFWLFWKWPDMERMELTKQRDWIIIHNGDKGYEITFRGTAAEEPKPLEDFLRREHYSLQNVLRVWLKQPGVAYFYEGPASAERKAAEQVSILNTKNEGVTLYIDQNSFLPIKKTFVWRDPKTRERNEEAEIYDNYRPVQGIMTPFSITRRRNDLATNQRFINEVKYNQGLSDSLFQATVTIKSRVNAPETPPD